MRYRKLSHFTKGQVQSFGAIAHLTKVKVI